MRKAVTIAALVLFAASATLMWSGRAGAYKPHRYHHGYHHHGPAWVVPPPPGKSTWCQRNPKKCYSKKNDDPKVDTRCEHCLDAMGNGDGYISSWEIRDFYKRCSVCN